MRYCLKRSPHLFNSRLLVYSFIMKTLPIVNATKIPCEEHRKLEPFVVYCLVVSGLDKILQHKRNVTLKQNLITFFVKNMLRKG